MADPRSGRWLVGRAALADIARATIELGLARLRISRRGLGAPTAEPASASAQLDAAQQSLIDRVAYVVPRVAGRVPWRADCLVQASAAERWLRHAGIGTTLNVGVPNDLPTDFEAHAWLSAGDRIVTGGDISGYSPLIHRQATDAS